ncbi:DBP6 [Candida pseudojiufengensis]|uniref:DBP6 n=1 Tax=Candida pseudojiufengensis TaxID=497109 RepID=UPI002224D57A|nr:DBP6 [Candida pseudojiufengensis]KAI5962689.1 DBP6 [Candida pseudojiufengensis]
MFGVRYNSDEDTNQIRNATPIKLNIRKRARPVEEHDGEEEEEESSLDEKPEKSDNDSDSSRISDDSDESESEEDKDSEEDHLSEDNEDDMEIDEPITNDTEYIKKHQSVFDKFKQSANQISHDLEKHEEEDVLIDTQDLVPLPQPQLPRDRKLTTTSQHLKNLDWLAKPEYILPSQTKPFSEYQLTSFILNNLKSLGIKDAFAVQVSLLNKLLPEIIKNKIMPDAFGDILVNASTGSGKTLAYCIPIIQALYDRVVPRVRAIILVPTKPLINQVRTTLLQLSQGSTLNIVSLKNDISIKEESNKLKNSVPDIIVSTPGRLVEHLNLNSISLSSLNFLVIDEADRLLNQTFQNWSSVLTSKLEEQQPYNILDHWSIKAKKLIFSATLTTDAGKLANLNLYKPRLIVVNDSENLVNELFSVPSTLIEYNLHLGVAKNSLKPLILVKFLITQSKLSNVLIFTKSNESSIRLSRLLQLIFDKLNVPINIAFINSTNNRTSIRSKILKDFTNQKINILIATDLIARGIDLTTITDVINYDLPNSSREYIHRVGRTARANQSGKAFNFIFGKGELKWFNTFSKDVSRHGKEVENFEFNVAVNINDSEEKVYQEALNELQQQAKS